MRQNETKELMSHGDWPNDNMIYDTLPSGEFLVRFINLKNLYTLDEKVDISSKKL